MKKIIFLSILSIPANALAFANLQQAIPAFGSLIAITIPVIFSLALAAFIWGLSLFVLHAGDEKKTDEGKRLIKWGIIALFVMMSIWGIVYFFQSSFGFNYGFTPGVYYNYP